MSLSRKEICRKHLKETIFSLPSKEEKKLFTLNYFNIFIRNKKIKNVISYYPDEYELNPSSFLTKQVKVFFPSIINKKLLFVYPTDVKVGKFGILEPIGSETIEPQEADLCFIPCLGINNSGYRLGRGGGFYDRTFENVKSLKIGFGFDKTHVCNFKEDNHDMKYSFFITSEGVLSF